jgi:signal transduction histidine kinase
LAALRELKFDQNNIQVNFGFIDLKNQNISMRYRLSALSNWNYTIDRTINFFSLSPGDYFIELEYSTDNFHWTSALTYPINISPQWWMNWRFQLVALVIVITIGILYYRRRIRLLREKQNFLKIINDQQQKLIRAELETLESERSRIAKDLHDSIGTNLAAIKLFLSGFFKKSNETNAAIIEATLQETIQGTKDIIANLAPADLERFGLLEAIKIHTRRIKNQFNITIEIHSLGHEVNKPEINIHLFRIVQELLTNSLKYASAKKITVTINFNSDVVKVTYKDDVIGFNINSITKGHGLLNIQSRVQILEGSIQFESGKSGVSYFMEVPLKTNQS